jgi:hypothetical protein
VPGRGNQTEMPRAALPRSSDSAPAIIMLIALGISTLFVAVQIGFALTFAPLMISLFTQKGLELPLMLSWAQALGPIGIFLVLAVLDALIFVLCAWASRRYWVGLLFMPPAIYLATTFVLFIGLVGGSAAVGLVAS